MKSINKQQFHYTSQYLQGLIRNLLTAGRAVGHIQVHELGWQCCPAAERVHHLDGPECEVCVQQGLQILCAHFVDTITTANTHQHEKC